jgi:hypothetical protein
MSPFRKLERKFIRRCIRLARRFPGLSEANAEAANILHTVEQVEQFPRNSFTDNGFEVFEGFLDGETCDHLKASFESYLHDSLPPEESGAYVVSRMKQPLDSYDRNVYQLMNAQKLPEFADVCASIRPRLELTIRERLGDTPVYFNSFSIQRDFPDDQSKRPYHNDSYHVHFKAFIYLTDVLDKKNGPYTVIPGSHRHLYKRVLSAFKNARTGNKRLDDVYHTYDDRDSVSVCGKKGTLILSIQTLAHKGWHEHTEGTRDVMVVYIQPNHVPEWSLGKNLALDQPLAAASA